MPILRYQTETAEGPQAFNYNSIPVGYYHRVMQSGNSIRRAWHLHKFQRIIDCLPSTNDLSILDIGCFAGSFLSLLPGDRFKKQVGVDILKKQIDFANRNFHTAFREFKYIVSFSDLHEMNDKFDCVTLVEVMEHLSEPQIVQMFHTAIEKLKPGGKLVISTPNYFSIWPLLEILVNWMSDISYEEQHLTKFNFVTVKTRLKKIFPELEKHLTLDFKTTTHFLSPFLAIFSLSFARKVSMLFPHQRWHFPMGNLILLVFTRR